MSRVIKFRAWYLDIMWLPEDIQEDSWELSALFHGQIQFMQFTGLTDCNGVEIYESDLVTDHIGTGIVKYSGQHAGFRVAYGNGRAKWFYDYLESERKTIEVIGNIYEHPHLLDRPSESP